MKRFLFIGLFGVAVAAAAFGLNYFSSNEPAAEHEAAGMRPAAPAMPNRVARDSGIPVPAPPPVAAYKAGPNSAGQPTQPSPPAESPPVKTPPPTFDVVRINPAGDAVIAGRAAPGATVFIYDGETLTGTVEADDRGDWVYLPGNPLPPGKRELSLLVRDADSGESRSESVVVLMVPERAGKAAVDTPVSKPAGALAVLVSRDGSTPSRVLQQPSEPRGVGGKDLSIGIVDYDNTGKVSIGGKGNPGVAVQVYVDNRLVGRSTVGPEGNWTVGPEQNIVPGTHQLRVDATRKGKVVSRVEMPFSRADPETVSADEALVVVQPGNSLWRIARRTLGAGVRYIDIYQANQSKIIDPDLIYPGQIFSLPKTN